MTPALAQDQDALLKRGEYLINGPVACGNCHNTRAEDMSFVPGMEFAGGFHIVDKGIDAYAANITPDPDTGIGTWTDEQIITAIREGKTPDGEIIFPPMPVPTYNNMSDDDVKAIVAYLRTVKPVHNEVPELKFEIPQQAMPPAKGAPAPSPDDKLAYGGYIVNALAHCFECHTSPDANGVPDFKNSLGAGGFIIQLAPGMTVATANITSDPETGLGKLERRPDQDGDHQGYRQGGRASLAADALHVLCQHDAARPRRGGRLCAHHPADRQQGRAYRLPDEGVPVSLAKARPTRRGGGIGRERPGSPLGHDRRGGDDVGCSGLPGDAGRL